MVLFPTSTERPLQHVPYATISLIAANVILFMVTVSMATAGNSGAMMNLILNPDGFHWWQVFSAMFMHAGILHLGMNMLFLWVFGAHCEDVLGIPLYLTLYFSAGLAATTLQAGMDLIFFEGMRGGLGASGCIMGLVALFATRFRRVKVNFFYWYYFYVGNFRMDAIWVAGIYFAFDLLLGFGSGVGWMGSTTAHFAHIGGFLCGLVWAWALKFPEQAADDELDAEMTRIAASGAYTLAATRAEEELQRRPHDPDLHARAARYYAMKPDTEHRANEHWNQALRLWLRRGQTHNALDRWRRLNCEHPPEVFEADVLMDLAVAFDNRGDYGEAARLYAAVAGRHTSGSSARLAAWRLAQMLQRTGRDEDARRWLQHIIRTWPDSTEALDAEAALDRL
ncbi:MAG: rhomboid family intramembrane serine protease [Armatimonadota bacterium]